MRVLALDLGMRRIGVALSDPLGLVAGRLMVLERTTLQHDLEAISQLIQDHQVDALVIGFPLTMRGERGTQAQAVEVFAEHVRQRTAVPIHFVDERLTTKEGTRMLIAMSTSRRKRKQVIDQVAAQLILQQFLDRQRPVQQSQG